MSKAKTEKIRLEHISGFDWTAIVNAEAKPDKTYFKLQHYQLGNKYAVHIESGYGNLVSNLVDTLQLLKEEEVILMGKYAELKECHGENKYNPITGMFNPIKMTNEPLAVDE